MHRSLVAAAQIVGAAISVGIGWLGGSQTGSEQAASAVQNFDLHCDCNCRCETALWGELQLSSETRVVGAGAGGVLALAALWRLLIGALRSASASAQQPRPAHLPALTR